MQIGWPVVVLLSVAAVVSGALVWSGRAPDALVATVIGGIVGVACPHVLRQGGGS